jgi:hypothetical protein
VKVATKHDIETIINHIKHFENDAREQHEKRLINGDETVWSSYHFGYAEGIKFCLDTFNKAIWNNKEIKSEQNKVAVEKLEELSLWADFIQDTINGFYIIYVDDLERIINKIINELKGGR